MKRKKVQYPQIVGLNQPLLLHKMKFYFIPARYVDAVIRKAGAN